MNAKAVKNLNIFLLGLAFFLLFLAFLTIQMIQVQISLRVALLCKNACFCNFVDDTYPCLDLQYIQ